MNNIIRQFILIIHSIGYIVLLILPFITSNHFRDNYGFYISWFMTLVILSWIIFGKCLLTNIDSGNNKYGSIHTFINNILNIDTGNYSYIISLIMTLLYCYSAYYFSINNKKHQYFIILITIILIYLLYT